MTQFLKRGDPPRAAEARRSQRDSRSKPWSALRLFLLLALLLLALAGCSRVRNPEGWSGGALTEDMLFIGTRDGNLLALDRENGQARWKFELQGTTDRVRAIYATPAVFESTVYFGGYDGIFYALDLKGDIQWQTEVGGPIVGSPAIADGKVLFGSSDGNLYAYEVLEDPDPRPTPVWEFKTEGKVWSEPDEENGVVYFGSLDKWVYAVRLADGAEVWRFETGGAVAASPVIAKNRVLVGSFDSTFYAIDAQTGAEAWRFEDAKSWYWARPLVLEGTVYAPSLDGNLYALDIQTGELRWTFETKGPIIGAPAAVLDLLAVPSRDAETKAWQIALVDPSDGFKVGVCNIEEEIRTPLASEGDLIYFGARDRSIRAVRVKESGNPDEEWIHFTDRDDPLPRGRAPAC